MSESTPLLDAHSQSIYSQVGSLRRSGLSLLTDTHSDATQMEPEAIGNLNESLAGLNALEIAAVANAKKFLSQKPVQKLVEDIWKGDVIFWETVSNRAVKKARTYNERVADPFSRLRVPKYQKAFQILFSLHSCACTTRY